MLSHDLRSPLSTFHSFSEVIDICAEHNEVNKVLEISKEMRSSSANLLDLLDNVITSYSIHYTKLYDVTR